MIKMTTTFLYEKNGEGLYIGGSGNDLRFVVEQDDSSSGVTLDQVGRDALRNYLDALEEEEEIVEQSEQVMWKNVEF